MISNLSYSPETANLGQIRRFLEPCDLEIWRMTLKNNRAPLQCYFKLCASFCSHWWIQTGVTVRKCPIWVKFGDFQSRVTLKFDGWPWKTIITTKKRLSWVLTSVTLTFDLWPWPFAWTSLLTMVITSENFMMIRWWEHGVKVWQTDRWTDGWTDRRMDRRTDWTSHIAAWSQLKMCC